jgi:hypothetical protein
MPPCVYDVIAPYVRKGCGRDMRGFLAVQWALHKERSLTGGVGPSMFRVSLWLRSIG